MQHVYLHLDRETSGGGVGGAWEPSNEALLCRITESIAQKSRVTFFGETNLEAPYECQPVQLDEL